MTERPTESPPPPVAFTLTADDMMIAAELAGTYRGTDRRWAGRGLMFAGSTGATLTCLAGSGTLTPGVAGLSIVLTAVFVAAYTGYLWPDPTKARRRAVAAQLAGNARRTVSLDDVGVRVAHRLGESLTLWAGVSQAAVTDDHLLLFFRLNNATLPVPRRAFATGDAFAAFAAVARRRAVPDADDGRPTGGFPVLPVSHRR